MYTYLYLSEGIELSCNVYKCLLITYILAWQSICESKLRPLNSESISRVALAAGL